MAIILVAGYGIYHSQKKEDMSSLVLANIEALANGENGDNTCSFEKVKKNEKDHSLECKGTGRQCCKLD